MRGQEPHTPELLADQWWNCDDYLWGIDLFNYGYYWEAHEAWEGLWHAAGRQGPTADFLKGLIKLAAAGVKTRAGSIAGRTRHARRAAELFRLVRSGSAESLMGLNLEELTINADLTADVASCRNIGGIGTPALSFVLSPDRAALYDL